jgi:hypothetical protein
MYPYRTDLTDNNPNIPDVETVETNPMLETDIDLTDEQFGYDRALRELVAFEKSLEHSTPEIRMFVNGAVKYLRTSYKDEL